MYFRKPQFIIKRNHIFSQHNIFLSYRLYRRNLPTARVKEHIETSVLSPYWFSYIIIPIARFDTFLAIFLLFFLLLVTTSKEWRNSYPTNVTSATLTKTGDVEISPIMEPRYARPRLPKSTRAFAHFQLSFWQHLLILLFFKKTQLYI